MASRSSSSTNSDSSEGGGSQEVDVAGIVSMSNYVLNEFILDPRLFPSLLPTATADQRQRARIDRGRVEGNNRLIEDYFSDTPTYNDRQFRGRFRMRRPLFLRIVEALSNQYPYFHQRIDCCGQIGLSPLQKCTAAIRMLAYGVAADAVDDYVRIGASTTQECLMNFVTGVETIFGAEYLRRPNALDIQRLLSVGETRGFPGMLGSIDCMHWGWKNCPSAWKGQFSRGDHGKPTIVLEAVASYDTWIWHAFFGVPGTCNDINVLDRSPLFNDVYEGRAPPVNFTVNGHEYNMGYYLADGIYPPHATFVQTIRLPQSVKAQLFATRQEAARKDVERAFGILQSRFSIIKGPARIHQMDAIGKVMRACIILHNMIVEDERDTYSTQYELPEYEQAQNVNFQFANGAPTSYMNYIQNRSRSRDRNQHNRLRNDLIEHIWNMEGNE